MTPIKKAMIFAAGKGTRLQPLTLSMPKPLVPVAGQPTLFHVLQNLVDAGVVEVVMNLGYMADKIEESLYIAQLSGYFPQLTLHFSYEDQLLETGGGLKKALPLLGEGAFFVVNADAVWQEETFPLLPELAQKWDAHKMGALLAVVPTMQAHKFRTDGDLHLKTDGTLTFARDKKLAPYIYAGIHITTADVVANFPKDNFSLTEVWRPMADHGGLYGHVYSHPWADMGSPRGLSAANSIMADRNPYSKAI